MPCRAGRAAQLHDAGAAPGDGAGAPPRAAAAGRDPLRAPALPHGRLGAVERRPVLPRARRPPAALPLPGQAYMCVCGCAARARARTLLGRWRPPSCQTRRYAPRRAYRRGRAVCRRGLQMGWGLVGGGRPTRGPRRAGRRRMRRCWRRWSSRRCCCWRSWRRTACCATPCAASCPRSRCGPAPLSAFLLPLSGAPLAGLRRRRARVQPRPAACTGRLPLGRG